MNENTTFNPESYQQYVDTITDLVKSINQLNQDIYGAHQSFAQEGYLAYGEHMQSLMTVTNPLDYFKLHQKFINESSTRFQRLANKRYKLVSELSQKLNAKDSIMFLFPAQIQDEIKKFSMDGNIEVINPEIWAKFTNVLLGR